MKTKGLLIVLVIMQITANAQTAKRSTDLITAMIGAGRYRGSFSASYEHNWSFGKNRRLEIGLGGRFTTFLAANLDYITAPAKLTTESTSPLIIFQENIEANLDTILIKSPQVNSLNGFINIDYKISRNFTVGFSIDAIGFSFGSDTRVNFMTGNTGKNTDAHVTPFNVLLVSDNDKGSLNSDLYLRYSIGEKWCVRIGAQFLFTEYTTDEKVQQFPEENDRFRNKSLLGSVGVSFKL